MRANSAPGSILAATAAAGGGRGGAVGAREVVGLAGVLVWGVPAVFARTACPGWVLDTPDKR